MTHFFTGTGDEGFTGLLGEDRVPKYHPRTQALGDLDESVAAIGLARAISRGDQSANILLQIQRDLYQIMAEISATPVNAQKFRTIQSRHVEILETITDEITNKIDIPSEFILPGDTFNGAAMAMARTIVRRAERSVVKLFHDGEIENQEIIRYLNRLSSLLFVLELVENAASGINHTTRAKS